MVQMSNMSKEDAKELITDINGLMLEKYKIDGESINEFWGTMQIGYNAIKIA